MPVCMHRHVGMHVRTHAFMCTCLCMSVCVIVSVLVFLSASLSVSARVRVCVCAHVYLRMSEHALMYSDVSGANVNGSPVFSCLLWLQTDGSKKPSAKRHNRLQSRQ